MSIANSIRVTHPGRAGILYAVGAYVSWGLIPLYFKQLTAVDPVEIIAHRVVWSMLVMVLVKTCLPRNGAFRALLRSPRRLTLLSASAMCIGVNWLVFTWAVIHERVLDTSLGYFINPLFSILLGAVLLRERLRPRQRAAVALAALGVGVLVARHGQLPWVSLTLACTFGLYGLIRKQVHIDAFSGLLMESVVLLPVALAYLGVLAARGESAFFSQTWDIRGWLMLAGPVTAFPLALFAAGARRLTLSTLGFLQYIAPTMTFVLAVFLFREPFDGIRLAAFACIWAGLAVYSVDSLRSTRRIAIPAPLD